MIGTLRLLKYFEIRMIMIFSKIQTVLLFLLISSVILQIKVKDQNHFLKMHTAALACLYERMGTVNPMKEPHMHRLVTTLIKAGTKRPAKRTSVMPIKRFMITSVRFLVMRSCH